MTRSIQRMILTIGMTLVALTIISTPVMAAGPRIMIVYGQPLQKPVIFSNWGENQTLMVAANDGMSVEHARLKGRPSLRVAMFWGMGWVQYMKHHKPPASLHPSQANQYARFYPAYGSAPALFVFDSIPGPYHSLIRRIRPEGIAVLVRHGIPVRLPVATGSRTKDPVEAVFAVPNALPPHARPL
ncbi:MAG: hypothetical protein ACR2JC_06365 [Chloroflexota bacterium]